MCNNMESTCHQRVALRYGVLFYIAFVKSNAVNILGGLLSGGEYCHDPAHFADNALAIKAAHDGYNPFCLTELSVFLSSYVVTIQVINKIHECVCPKLAYLFRTCSEERSMFRARRHVVPMTFCERQAKLDVFEGVFNNYSFLTIQVSVHVWPVHGTWDCIRHRVGFRSSLPSGSRGDASSGRMARRSATLCCLLPHSQLRHLSATCPSYSRYGPTRTSYSRALRDRGTSARKISGRG